MPKGKKLSEEKKAELLKLIDEGHKASYISYKTGLAISTVVKYYYGSRRESKPWTSKELEKLLDLRYMEMPYEQIAKKLGRTVRQCYSRHAYYNQKKKQFRKIGV
jgi:hypothetical protein